MSYISVTKDLQHVGQAFLGIVVLQNRNPQRYMRARLSVETVCQQDLPIWQAKWWMRVLLPHPSVGLPLQFLLDLLSTLLQNLPVLWRLTCFLLGFLHRDTTTCYHTIEHHCLR